MSLRSVLPCIPSPNHLRLVGECYPASKQAVDPESNALGKLTFYTKSRPVKLSKVAKALLRRSQRSSEPAASLCVTLSILKKLLDECRSDIAVFSAEAIQIISLALQRRMGSGSGTSAGNAYATTEVFEKAAGAFFALVTFASLAAIDERAYISLLQEFCQVARDERSMQLRIIGLHALDGAVNSELLYAADFPKHADYIVPTLLFDIVDGNLDSQALESSLINGKNASASDKLAAPPQASTSARRPLHDRRARSIRIAKGLEGTEKPPGADDAARLAYKSLRTLFGFCLPRHIEAALRCSVDFVSSRNKGELWQNTAWCTWLAGRYLEWSQVQYRSANVAYWLDQLQLLQSTPSDPKNEAVLSILIGILSSPSTVLNLAVGEVLGTLSSLIQRNPASMGLRKALLALGFHTYYPEQLNDMVGDLLTDAVDLHPAAAPSKVPATIAVLECARDLLQSASVKGNMRLTYEQLCASLSLMEAGDDGVRRSYLETLQAILLRSKHSSMHTDGSTGKQTLPAITVTPLQSATSDLSRFAKALQIQLFPIVHKPTSDLEVDTIAKVLCALYARVDPQLVIEGVPILQAWLTGEHSEHRQRLVEDALVECCKAWNVEPSARSPAACTAALSECTNLQKALDMSGDDIRARLTKAYAHPQGGGSLLLSHTSPTRRAHSIRHGTTGAADDNRGNNSLSVSHGGRSRASSIPSTSLADLKNSLNQSTSSPLTRGPSGPGGITQPSGQSSPSRSSNAQGSMASSIRSSTNGHASGTITPPRGNGHDESGFLTLPDSITSSAGKGRKPRLERILGSTDENIGAHHQGHRISSIVSPPYQLT